MSDKPKEPEAPERVCQNCGVLDSKGTAENGDHVSSYGCVRALRAEIECLGRELETAEGKRVKFSPPDPSRDEAMRAYIEVMERAERDRIEVAVGKLVVASSNDDYLNAIDIVRGEEKP
jgi:hypothetical protein